MRKRMIRRLIKEYTITVQYYDIEDAQTRNKIVRTLLPVDETTLQIYLMTVSPSMISVKTLEDGTKINVRGILEFEEVKEETGEVVNIVSIIDDEKNVYSFQSKTFKRSLNDIAIICKDKPFTIIKTSGKTKAGRDFINCILDVSSIE